MAKEEGKKLKIPKTVKDLRKSQKKFAKKNGIRVDGKHMSKKEKKHNRKLLLREYSSAAAEGLDAAVRIMADYPTHEKIEKVKTGVENIIMQPDVMHRIAKLYNHDPKEYPNMRYLPGIIMNTLVYYSSDTISDDEKAAGAALNTEELVDFCERILKKPMKRYKKMGLSQPVAYQMATVIPTTKILKNPEWYRRLIHTFYDIAESTDLNFDQAMQAVVELDKKKKKGIGRKEFLWGFFSEFVMMKTGNKLAKMNDRQRELHDTMLERCLIYLNDLKPDKLREFLKRYIKRRKKSEHDKADAKREIRFTEHAYSNSPYQNIQRVVQEIISDDKDAELYLS